MEAHAVYVTVGGESREATLTLLHFIKDNLHTLKSQLGVSVTVHSVRPKAMQENPMLIKALQSKGITSMPALLTKRGVFLGAQAIMDKYTGDVRRAHESRQHSRESLAPRPDAVASDDIDGYLQRAVMPTGEESDDDEMGESAKMLDEYRKRSAGVGGRPEKPVPARGRPPPAAPPRSQGAPRPVLSGSAPKKMPASMRADNLQTGPAAVMRPAPAPMRAAAMPPPDDDDAIDDDDSGGRMKDEQMLRAMRANSEHSLPESDNESGYGSD